MTLRQPIDVPQTPTSDAAIRFPTLSRKDSHMMRAIGIAGASALVLLGACTGPTPRSAGIQTNATATPPPVAMRNTETGTVLTDAKGMSFYVYSRDGADKSNCNGSCAQQWIPVPATADARTGAQNWSVVARDDGARQWAYKSRPLYSWVGDQKPGDTFGQHQNGDWSVATP